MTTNPTSGAADLPEALRSIQRFEVVDCIDSEHVPAVIPKPHGPWVRYADHVTALAAEQVTAAQPADPWRKAVTDACMPTEACFNGKDPAATINNLIDWHLQNERFHVAQQPGAAYAALPEPAAVAGQSGYGPKVTVKRRCSDCKACNSESYAVQGDSGHYVYCEHPSLPERKYIGDTNWNTPHWCPVSAPTTQPAPQQGEGRNLQAVINAAADKLDAAKRCHQSAVDTLIDEALEILDGDRDPHKPAPQQEAQEPILYDPKALLEVFQNAQAGSSCPAGTLRGIAAVIASWESREPHTLIAAPQPSLAAQGDALDAEYQRGYRQGYEQRDAEVRGALV